MKRVGIYLRVSTLDQNPENQTADLRQLAEQRGWEIVREYRDHGVSGARARRPSLDQMLSDARQGKLDVIAVWACDRLARSVRHFLEVLDQLHHWGVEFVSFREQLDTSGPLGRALVVIIAVIAELERGLIAERVKAGMRRARLEGSRIGRPPANIDRQSVVRDRARGHSLTVIAKDHRVSRALISRILKEENQPGHKGCALGPSQSNENRQPATAA